MIKNSKSTLSFDQYLTAIGKNPEEFEKELSEKAIINIKTDLIINDHNRELTCFSPAQSTAYYWGFGEGSGMWSITEFDVDTVPLLSVSGTYFNTENTMNTALQTEVLVAIIDTLDVNVGTMDTIFHSYETIETDGVLGEKVYSVALSDTFFNQPDQAVFVIFRPQTEAVWGIDGPDTTYLFSPFFMSDDGASWSGLSGQTGPLGNFFTLGGADFGMADWADFKIDLCADVPRQTLPTMCIKMDPWL